MPEESERWRTTKRQDRDFPDFLWIEKDNWRGFLKKRYEDLLLIAENEKAWFDRAIRIFNRTPNRVYEVPFPFGDDIIYVVIKAFGWREKFHYWLSPFMKSKAFNSLFTALTLERNGLLTPKPLAALERRENSLVRENIYITESLGEFITLRDVLRKMKDESLSNRLIKKAGEYVRRMHEAGIFHGDLTLANFLIKEGEEDFYLVDLNRSRLKKRNLLFLEKIEDIAKMDFKEDEFRLFLRAYFSPDEPDPRFENLVIFRARWKRKSRALRKGLVTKFISSLKGLRFGHES